MAVPQPVSQQLRAVELFSGIGGFRIAADRLGLETVFANDLAATACEVYRSRFGDDVLVQGSLADHLDDVPAHDVLTAGFPCQPFSSAGKKRGSNDERAQTIWAMLEVIARHRPRAVVLENVPFLLAARRGAPFRELLRSLAELGYSAGWRVINAADLGLPQFRPRVVLVAVEGSRAPLLWDSVDGDMPSLVPEVDDGAGVAAIGLASEGMVQVVSRRPRPRDWASLRLTDWLLDDADARFDFTANTLERIKTSTSIGRVIRGVEVLYNQRGGSRMGYTVYGVSGLAPTLTATTSRHYERFKIGDTYRRLTPEEYELLQGFPMGHSLAARQATRYVLCGNAIAPPVAEWGLGHALAALKFDPTDMPGLSDSPWQHLLLG